MTDRNRNSKNSSRHKQQSINRGHKILTVSIFVALSIYLLGYLVMFANKPSIPIEPVSYGSIDVPLKLRGIIVRDEIVVKSEMDGQTAYNYSENAKVAKNAVVCTVKNTGATQDLESGIKKLDKDIIELQKNRTDFSIFKEDIEKIQGNITNLVDENVYKLINADVSSMYSFKSQVENQINLRNQIWLAENNKSTAALTDEKEQYEQQLSNNSQTIAASSSGIFSLRVDGFEDIVTPKGINDIAEEQTKMTVQPEYISKSIAVKADTPLFKLITSNTWYIVSYVPNEMASKWEDGDFMDICATIDEEEKRVRVKIQSMVPGDKTTYIVFVTDRNIIDFLDLRTFDFKVEGDVYEGFKIPNEAIVEKTFIKIPKTALMVSLEDTGVVKRTEGRDEFVNMRIAESDEKYVYILQDFGTLKLGDVIVPPGEKSQTYTLSEVATYKGVYVANSSVAVFTIVDILGQNSEYSIVDAESQYGLKIYDRIVSDAKVVENQENVN